MTPLDWFYSDPDFGELLDPRFAETDLVVQTNYWPSTGPQPGGASVLGADFSGSRMRGKRVS